MEKGLFTISTQPSNKQYASPTLKMVSNDLFEIGADKCGVHILLDDKFVTLGCGKKLKGEAGVGGVEAGVSLERRMGDMY
jgi:hypothetical protein